jgi:GT2 family glycosyltransferase
VRIAAVVVSAGAPSRAVRAVEALARLPRPPEALLVVDNGGAAADALRAALPAATVLATGANLGFAGGANAGIAAALAAGAEAVLLVNDDAWLAPDALALLEAALAAPGVGLAGPALLSADGQRVESLGLSFAPRSGRLRELGRGQPWPGPAPPREVQGVSGCVLLARRAALLAVGGLDPGFFFYFEDLDLCLRARAAGWRTVVVPAARAWHEGSATIGRRSPRRLYHAARGHLRLGSKLPGTGRLGRQAAILGWNLAHALRRRAEYEPGALRAVLRAALDHARGRPHGA